MADDKKAKPSPPPVPAPTTPALTLASLPPLVPTPGVAVDSGEVVRRCPGCNKLSRWQSAFIDQHRGGSVMCPICGAAVRCE